MTTLIQTDAETNPGLTSRRGRVLHGVTIDWGAIERDYRSGHLSLRQMSFKHGCSHSGIANLARREGWVAIHVPPWGSEQGPDGDCKSIAAAVLSQQAASPASLRLPDSGDNSGTPSVHHAPVIAGACTKV